MADRVSPAVRSRIMRAIRRENTTPERNLATALQMAGVPHCRGSAPCCKHLGRLPGRPDFILHEPKLAVFVNGCFWHLCRQHYKAPAGERWRVKMDANRRRDVRVRRQLRRLGWRTMVVWEHELPGRAALRVKRRAQGHA